MPVLSPAEQQASRAARLAAAVTLPTGQTKRWGPDEASTQDVLAGLSFSTSDPGGFKDSNFGLARNVDIDWSDLGLLYDLKIYGAGGRSAWEGRLHERPGRHGDGDQVSPGAVGWQSHLSDRPFQEIYIDGDLTHWGEPSVERRIARIVAGFAPGSAQTSIGFQDKGSNASALMFDFTGVQATATLHEGAELWYYGNGVDLGNVLFDQVGDVSGTWIKDAVLATNDNTSTDPSGNYTGQAENNNQDLPALGAGRKYAYIETWHTNNALVGQMTNLQRWRNVRVVGRHGLTRRGTWPTQGFYASDMIADLVGRFAPKLNFTIGEGGSITPTSYIVPQAAFREPTTPANAISALNAYHQYSWGVEDNKRFFFRPTSSYRKRWRIRRSRGDQVELLGPQADAAVNGVIVSFTDPSGQQRVIGPPEMSTAYATSEALVDTRATNPVNIVGLGPKWGELSLGFVTDVSGAIQIGAMWLAAQLATARSRGSVRVTGIVEDENGAYWPSWAMRAGDSATVVDGDRVERRIVESTYSADSRQANCQLDSTPHKFEAILERMGIAVAGL